MQHLIGSAQVDAYRDLLANRDFRRWFWSSLGSSFGDWVGLFALQVLVVSMAEPGSRLALFGLGGLMMARLLPSAVFGPLSGVVADRYNRKRLMISCDLARAGLFVWVAFSRELVVLFVLVLVIESLSLLYLSAKHAALPVIVPKEQLTEANQLTLLISYGPLPFGAGAAALMAWGAGLLGRFGLELDPTGAALLLNALTFLLAGLLILRLRSIAGSKEREEPGDPSPGPVEQLREGLLFIKDRRLIRSLILGVIGVFFGAGMVIALGPEFVRSDLGKSEGDWYGLMTTVGFGLLAGILATPFVTARLRKAVVFPSTLTATAGLTIATGLMGSFPLVQAVGFLLGALAGVGFVTGYTLLHERSDDEVRARTFAAFNTGSRVSMFVALGFGPFVAGAIGRFTVEVADAALNVSGVRVTIVFGGVVALLSAIGAARGMLSSQEEGAES